MRKQVHLTAALCAAMIIAAGMPLVSFAAGGWQRERVGEEEAWVYLDGDGNRMTDVLLEYESDIYYLDGNGIMAENQWVLYPHDPGGQEAGDAQDGSGGDMMGGGYDSAAWYYFSSSGKAYRGARKIIDGGNYVFNGDGSLITGRLIHLDDHIYYANEDGALAVNQWVSFLNGPGNEEPCEEPVTTVWYYFGPTGKASAGKKKKIGENTYIFDDEGHMLSGWQTYEDDSDLYYLGTEDQGFIHTGWVYTYGPEGSEASGEEGWYYLDGKGVPFNYQAKDSNADEGGKYWGVYLKADGHDLDEPVKGAAARVIDKKTYLFDGEGRMMTGVYHLMSVKRKGGPRLGNIPLGSNFYAGAAYYFNEEEGAAYGQMMTGEQTVEVGGHTYHYYFEENGQAYGSAIADGSLYDAFGVRVESDSDDYMLYIIPKDLTYGEKGSGRKYKDCTLIVSPSGKLKKSGTVVIDGFKYRVRNYKVVEMEEDD